MAQQSHESFEKWLARPIAPEEMLAVFKETDWAGRAALKAIQRQKDRDALSSGEAAFTLAGFKMNALRAGIEAKQSEAASVLGIPQSVIDAYLDDEITIFEFFERLREAHTDGAV